ncbi:MAG: cation transporter [Clostridiaceae bacterium]|nr:cation transporter [Clostridiaceae bacterium]NBH78358.1 cation transporter [Clostridiaceae bacterium]NBI81082.1 cation transporter [Clostridiaceae bacterium]
MTDFLIHRFIPGWQDTRDARVRERYGILSGFVGLLCNAFLFAVKLAIGLLTGSISIAADAVNNLSDGLSSLISIIGFKLAAKAPDSKHPFGYGRSEYIAGLAVSFLIMAVGLEFLKSSVGRILHPAAVRFSPVLAGILALSILVKLWMGLFNRRIGKAINSAVLLAAMQDSINDVITTSVVILGMVAGQFTDHPVDGYIGVLVALFILWAGWGVAKDTLAPLLGECADPESAAEIESLVLGFPEIVGIHDLIIHNYGAGKSLASLHAEVPDSSDFVAVHEVIDEAEKLVWQRTGIYLVIHMDPISLNDERVNAARDLVTETLLSLDGRLSMHDFRMVDGKKQINLIFDVIIPFEYTPEHREALRRNLTDLLKRRDIRYNPVITLEHRM